MKLKKPKLGEMVRITYKDNASAWRTPYREFFFDDGTGLIARGRFIGAVNGLWFIESCNPVDNPSETNHSSMILENCITEVKIFGFDDSPLPEDLEDILKRAKEEHHG